VTSKKKLKREIKRLKKELTEYRVRYGSLESTRTPMPSDLKPVPDWLKRIRETDTPLLKLTWGWSDDLPSQEWLNSLHVDDDGKMSWE
jgi:hypothetical protein